MNTPSICLDVPEPRFSLSRLAWIGIDNGRTGAIARIAVDGGVLCEPVITQDLGRETLLDVDGNLALLRHMIAASGAKPEQVIVVFEQAQITPKFGYKNNYTNGRNNEFWRVLLTIARIPFAWVNPRKWQNYVFADIRGDDTKEMAEVVRRQRFPTLDVSQYTKIQLGGINDAVCIALWAQQTMR